MENKSNQNHLCPVCGKECPKHSASTKKKPKWKLFCSDKCKYSPKGQEICNQLQKESLDKLKDNDSEYFNKVKSKREETNLKKFGVKYPSQLDSVKQHNKQFNEEHKEEIQKKAKEGIRKKYGVESVFKSEEIQSKIKQTNLKRYNVEYPFQSKSIQNKTQIKYLTTQYNKILNSDEFKPLFTLEEWIDKCGATHDRQVEFNFKCKHCGEVFSMTLYNGFSMCRCPKCNPYYQNKAEQEIFDWLSSLGVKSIERNKRDWNGQRGIEADLYLTDYNLAIEYNGLYWHSNINKSDDYHFNKWKFFKDQNIDCMQIFENEWRDKKDIVKSIIMNRLGLNKKIYGRKCMIKELGIDDYKSFTEQNHLQGYCNAKVRLGLYYNDELVMVMSFSKPRFNKKYDWENIRTCSKIGHCVIGGFSKLLKYFKENYSGSIVSYIDSRYFDGKGYITDGFKYIGHSKPNYFYFINKENVLHNRVEFQKHKLKDKLNLFDENLTEKENMLNNSWNWIYDCGNEIVEYKYH